jgi:hypothetical protein
MRKILQKIAWKTNRWNYKFSLFNIYLGGDHNKFGVQIVNLSAGWRWEGSLLEITWCFPTVTHRGMLNIDILFLFELWDNWCIDLSDRKLWGSKLNRWESVNLYLNSKFKSIG